VELRQLHYLSTIARTGGFRRAADELDLSQATLSEQIKFLEQELGVRLFDRGTRTLRLTQAGQVLLERADRILEEVKTAHDEMLEFAHLERGQLIVGTMTGNGPYWLPSFLAAFMRRYPHLELTLVERVSGLLLRMLDAREIHVAVLLVPTEDEVVPPNVCVRKIYTRDLVVVVSHQHRLAGRGVVSLDEIAAERLILTSPDEAPRVVVDRAFRARGLEPSVGFEADDPATLIGLAAEGIAIGITGDHLARRAADKVAALSIEGERMQYSMAVAWSDRGPQTRAMDAFLVFASDWLAGWAARTTEPSAEAIS
jgi:DNA-binding transcriptional LysR family regulator